MSFAPNDYQVAILNWIREGRGHALVEACAGSGKSSTLVLASQAISSSGLFLAFNKHIADELAGRLRGTPMDVRTIHSLGFAAIRYRYGNKVKVDASKYRKILREIQLPRPLTTVERAAIEQHGRPNVSRLCDIARADLVKWDDHAGILARIEHHAMDIRPELEDLAAEMTSLAMRQGQSELEWRIDFTDMIWAPNICNLTTATYPWVMVDEAQDLSRAQLGTALRAMAPGGRVLAVGDSRQGIFGFAGADSQSIPRIIDRLDAEPLPLSICYRCPKSHIELAQKICLQIEPAPNAIEGEILTWKPDDLVSKVREGDMVLCRRTAPLLKVAYQCIGDGISAAVKGRDIGKGLSALAKGIAKLGPFSEFAALLQRWKSEEIEALLASGRDCEARIESIEDRCECLETVAAASRAKTLDELTHAIESLFATDRPSVLCSTVHRAKGLENDRIIIIEPDLLRNPRAKRDWQMEQERNLAYVAYTRAKKTLVFVE